MTLNSDFIKNPLEFANQYAIVPERTLNETLRGDDSQKITLARFSFIEDDEVQVGGYATKAARLVLDNNGFPCYWLSYEENKSKRCVIGTDARYMFTFTMDGCSFGVGSKTGSGQILVAHANAIQHGADSEAAAAGNTAAKLATGQAAQAAMQLQMLKKKMDLSRSMTVLAPSDYKDDIGFVENWAGRLFAKTGLIGSWVDPDEILKKSAITFGVRENTTWTFYVQRRVVTIRGQIVLRNVNELVTV